jgi:acyl-CoA hydrolase
LATLILRKETQMSNKSDYTNADDVIYGADVPLISRLVDVVFPGDTNHHGTLFGGAGFALMDRVAFIAATRHGRVPFVTASCERIDYTAPVKLGQIVELTAKAVRVGRTSLSVEVDMVAENMVGGERTLCTRGLFHMVAKSDVTKDKTWHLPPLPEPEAIEAVSGQPTLLRNSDVVFADQANSYGTMFGGEAMAAMSKSAFIAATRYCRLPTVLASSRRMDFKYPIKVGSILELVSKVIHSGRSSVVVATELWSEDLMTGERLMTAKGEFTMVAVDEQGHPVPVLAESGARTD